MDVPFAWLASTSVALDGAVLSQPADVAAVVDIATNPLEHLSVEQTSSASNWRAATMAYRHQLVTVVREAVIEHYMLTGRWPTVQELEALLEGHKAW